MANLKARLFGLLAVATAGLLLASAPAKAQTVTFNLTSAGSGDNLAGVYTSPYAGNINGGSTIPVICDDFGDNSYVPESWTAFVTQGTSLVNGVTNTTLQWANGYTVGGTTLSQYEAYGVAALLGQQILALSAPVQTPAQMLAQEQLSFALWGLFDPNGTASDPTGAFEALAGDTTDLNAAKTDLTNAIAAVTSATVQGYVDTLTIYTYDPAGAGVGGLNPSCGGSKCATAPPQEFIVINTPEPSLLLLLAMGLMLAIGLHFRKSLSSLVFRPVSVNR